MNLLKEREEKRGKREEERKPTTTTRVRELPDVDKSVYKSSAAFTRGILYADVRMSAAYIGMTAEEVNGWLKYMRDVGWRFTTGYEVNGRNFRRSLRMWHFTQRRINERGGTRREAEAERRRRAAEQAERQRMKAAAMNPGSWQLCIERCAFAKMPMGCKRGMTVPPFARKPPIPPEECPEYRAREVAV